MLVCCKVYSMLIRWLLSWSCRAEFEQSCKDKRRRRFPIICCFFDETMSLFVTAWKQRCCLLSFWENESLIRENDAVLYGFCFYWCKRRRFADILDFGLQETTSLWSGLPLLRKQRRLVDVLGYCLQETTSIVVYFVYVDEKTTLFDDVCKRQRTCNKRRAAWSVQPYDYQS